MSIIPEKYTTLSPLQEEYRKFWLTFNAQSLCHYAFSAAFKVHPIPSIRSYQDYSVGKPYHLVLKVDFKRNLFAVKIYFNNVPTYIEYYEQHRSRIEAELGYECEWKEQTTKGSAGKFFSANLYDFKQYNKIADQMMDEGLRMVRIFNKYSE